MTTTPAANGTKPNAEDELSEEGATSSRKAVRSMKIRFIDAGVILGILAVPIGLGATLIEKWDDASIFLPAAGPVLLAAGAVVQTWSALGDFHGHERVRKLDDEGSRAVGWALVVFGACVSAVVPVVDFWHDMNNV